MAARVLAWLGMAAVCASFGGCSKSDDAAPISRQDFPAAAANALCNSMAKCCSDSKFTFDDKNCRAANTNSISVQVLGGDDGQGGSVDQTRVAYDDQAAGECVAQLSSKADCGSAGPADAPACSKILVGKVKVGDPCGANVECAGFIDGKASCDRAFTGLDQPAVGTCVSLNTPTVVRTHGKLGENCFFSCHDDQDCEYSLPPGNIAGPTSPETDTACFQNDGLFCGTTGKCEALAKLGERCDSSSCVEGLFCNGRCTAPHPDGATCAANNECESNNCSTAGLCSKSAPQISAQECANGRRGARQ